MIQPFRELKAGMGLSAAELNRALAAIERATRIFVAPPLELTQDDAGARIRLRGGVGFFVRITGQSGNQSGGSGGPASALGPNCYSGIQLGSHDDGTVFDYESGTEFDATLFPLVEMTERTDVPIDAIVFAIPSGDGTHYEFVWEGAEQFESGGSGCGSGDGELTNCVTFDATTCIDGVNTTTTTTIEFPFQVRVRTG